MDLASAKMIGAGLASIALIGAGNIGGTKATFANYAAEVVGAVSTTYSSAETELSTATSLESSLSDAISSESGVNLDEETAKLSTLQNQYAAASQLISAINEMFNALISAVQSTG